MTEHRLKRLTQRQKECLRLVPSHGSSKAIALALGVTDSTVSNHLKAAMATIGVNSRYAAARLLVDFEADEPSPAWTSPPPTVATPPVPLPEMPPASEIVPEAIQQDDIGTQFEVAEEQMPFGAAVLPTSYPRPPIPTRGRHFNDLGTLERLIWIAIIALIATLAVGGALAALVALSRLFTSGSAL